MAQRRRPPQRRSSRRPSGPVYVAPVLDPTWKSPYEASSAERDAREGALQRLVVRRVVLVTGISVIAGALLALTTHWSFGLGVVVVGAAYSALSLRARGRQSERQIGLAASLITRFDVGGTPQDRQRLATIAERLAASFGLDGVTCMVVRDDVPNAALLSDRHGFSLVVTSGMMSTFDLIELEGVVAHCMARQRLGYLGLTSAMAATANDESARRAMARECPDFALRADEVGAATIRYPVGLAAALRRCAAARVEAPSYFASEDYARERFVWFDPYVDGYQGVAENRNLATVRAGALEEW